MNILILALATLPAQAADTPASGIAAAVQKDIGKFVDCYDTNTKDQAKKPTGKMVTRFTIGADGKVTKAEIVTSELKNEKLEACVVEALKTVAFPAPAGGATQVEYPFQFTPKAPAAKKKPRA